MNGDFRLGIWLVQPSLSRLSTEDSSVHIEPRTMDVLLCLAKRAGEVVTKQEILDAVWPDTFVEEVALARCVSELRKAVGDDPKAPSFIETIPKRGYRLVAAISTPAVRPRRAQIPASLTAMIVVFVLLLATFQFLRTKRAKEGNAAIRSVAVLPLRDVPDERRGEYFADGMTQMVISSLTQLGARPVISYGSISRFKNSTKPLGVIARELGVDALVEGTVRRRGDRVRIDVELVDATTGRNLWANSYERSAADLFNLQADVAEAIAKAIAPALHDGAGSLITRRAVSAQAYDAYLRGLYHLNHGTSEPSTREALAEFQSAIAAEPKYAEAYAALAMSYCFLSELWIPPDEAMPAAKAAAVKALQLDDQLASAHTALALVEGFYEWKWQAADREYRRAIELNPFDATARVEYGRFIGQIGDGKEAVRQLEIARDLDPLSLDVNRTLGIAYNQAGRYDDAIRQMKHRLAMDSSPGAGRFHLGNAYFKKHMYPEAIAQFEQIAPGPWRAAALGNVYAEMGRREEAEKMLGELNEMRAHRWVSGYSIAGLEAELDHPRKALDWLRVAYSEHDEGLMHIRTDASFQRLRAEPEFIQLAEKVFPPPSR